MIADRQRPPEVSTHARPRRSIRLWIPALALLLGASIGSTGCFSLNAATAPRRDRIDPTPVSTVLPDTNQDAILARLRDNTARATPTPAPTPYPGPTCEDAEWWYDLRPDDGRVTIQGPVADARVAVVNGRQQVVLDIGQASPDPNRAVVLLPADGASVSAPLVAFRDAHASICATGEAAQVDGLPALRVVDTSSVRRAPS